jgi:alpha-tubulin suppressor-like RCC1 family protein
MRNYEIESGELFLFGSNDHGQLGTGKTEREIFPFKVDLLSKVQSFSCGNKHTLALTEQGKAFGTGCNSTGELGIGNRKSSSIFTKITFQADGNLKKVAAG